MSLNEYYAAEEQQIEYKVSASRPLCWSFQNSEQLITQTLISKALEQKSDMAYQSNEYGNYSFSVQETTKSAYRKTNHWWLFNYTSKLKDFLL